MTRDEQIKKAEIKYSDNTLFDGCDFIGQVAKQEAFIAGAKWADETMIEKACEWLIENFYDHPHEQYFICSEAFDCIEEMVEQFMKAMKEE